MDQASEPRRGIPAPVPQTNYQRATELAMAKLATQPHEQLLWLGAVRIERGWRLSVLGDAIEVDTSAGKVTTQGGEEVSVAWRILVLHYLCISNRPSERPPTITFADLAASRSYAGVYQGRVISRFCATAGRNLETLVAAAEALSGSPADAEADAAFDFCMFPRITLRLLWHAADDEFPSSATVLMPENIEEYLCAEDIVVLSESLVARLGGRPF